MQNLISCMGTAKLALQETKTILVKMKNKDGEIEEVEQVVADLDQARKAVKFMAAYALKAPTQE